MLSVNKNNPFFYVNGFKIFYLFDPPHAIKAARNNFMNNDISAQSRIIYPLFIRNEPPVNPNLIKYEYVETLFNKDLPNNNKLAPKLTKSHIYPNNFEKMKVRFATQLLSNTVAAGLNTLIENNILPNSAIDTSLFVLCMDRLFDLFNSNSRMDVKKLTSL